MDKIPGKHDLWFLPLGGCGEIGMNLNLYGHNGQWLMVDCGVTFQRGENSLGTGLARQDVILPDPAFIANRRDSLLGLVLTHAHEDHLGAVPWLWPQLRCPIYTTPFTAEVLRRKMREFGLLDQVPLTILPTSGQLSLGHFHLQWIDLTHSIPEPQALLIKTSAGTVFHTADWKLDPDPVVGRALDELHYCRLANENVLAMMCDSTNALTEGHSESEGALFRGLYQHIKAATGRVVVTCFGSNVARMQTLVRAAHACGRYVGLLGRSLHNMVRAARITDHWPSELTLVEASHLGYLPPHEVLAIATGSQGEPQTALARLARGAQRDMELESGDTVIMSSRIIPGNEEAVAKLCGRFRDMGVHVIDASTSGLPIHASGHPCREELRKLYHWVKPRVAVPMHGEAAHMQANASIAHETGVPRQLIGVNGDLFQLAPSVRLRRQFVATGRLLVGEDRMQNTGKMHRPDGESFDLPP